MTENTAIFYDVLRLSLEGLKSQDQIKWNDEKAQELYFLFISWGFLPRDAALGAKKIMERI